MTELLLLRTGGRVTLLALSGLRPYSSQTQKVEIRRAGPYSSSMMATGPPGAEHQQSLRWAVHKSRARLETHCTCRWTRHPSPGFDFIVLRACPDASPTSNGRKHTPPSPIYTDSNTGSFLTLRFLSGPPTSPLESPPQSTHSSFYPHTSLPNSWAFAYRRLALNYRRVRLPV